MAKSRKGQKAVGALSPRLAARIPWREILRALGINSESDSLPTRILCPLCQGPLTISPPGGGFAEWFHCAQCGRSGELMMLAAAVWDLPPREALRRLAGFGTFLRPEYLEGDLAEKYQALDDRWQRLSDFLSRQHGTALAATPEHRAYHRELGLRVDADLARYAEYMAPYACDVDVREMETALEAKLRDRPYNSQASYSRLSGPDWHYATAFLAKDLPGRTVGLWVCGRQMRRPKDWAYLALNVVSTAGRSDSDCGVIFYDAVAREDPRFGRIAFALADPESAVRLQIKHFRDATSPLPVVGTTSSGRLVNTDLWSALPDRDWVFWAPMPLGNVLRQARAAKGRVVFQEATPEQVARGHYGFLERLSSEALPWADAIRRLAVTIDADRLDMVLTDMKLPEDEWAKLISDTPDQEARDILALCPACRAPEAGKLRLTSMHHALVVEREDGWYFHTTGEVITDAILRVDRVYCVPGSGLPAHYEARVLYQGKVIPFSAEGYNLRNRTSLVLSDVVLNAGMNLPRINAIWARRGLFELSLKFHVPEVVHVQGADFMPLPTINYHSRSTSRLQKYNQARARQEDDKDIMEAVARVMADAGEEDDEGDEE